MLESLRRSFLSVISVAPHRVFVAGPMSAAFLIILPDLAAYGLAIQAFGICAWVIATTYAVYGLIDVVITRRSRRPSTEIRTPLLDAVLRSAPYRVVVGAGVLIASLGALYILSTPVLVSVASSLDATPVLPLSSAGFLLLWILVSAYLVSTGLADVAGRIETSPDPRTSPRA